MRQSRANLAATPRSVSWGLLVLQEQPDAAPEGRAEKHAHHENELETELHDRFLPIRGYPSRSSPAVCPREREERRLACLKCRSRNQGDAGTKVRPIVTGAFHRPHGHDGMIRSRY